MRVILAMLLIVTMAKADITGLPCSDMLTGCKDALGKCNTAITDCEALVDAQKTEIMHLKQDVSVLQDQVVEEQNSAPSLPWYAYILLGAAGAVVAGRVFR